MLSAAVLPLNVASYAAKTSISLGEAVLSNRCIGNTAATAISPAKVRALLQWAASRLRAVFICLPGLICTASLILGAKKTAATALTGSRKTRSI